MKPWVHIIGGGLAGLSLASELGRYKKLPGDVIISEPNPSNLEKRTFSYWFQEFERPMLHPDYSTTAWRLGTSEASAHQVGGEMIYGTSTGAQVYRRAMKHIESHAQIHQQQESIKTMPDAAHVFDSRPCSIQNFKIIQSFSGIEIELSKPHKMDYVDLMKSMETTNTGLRFLYALPLGRKRILIEHTEFTTCPASFEALSLLNLEYIKKTFGASYRVIRHEKAHIPMGLEKPEPSFGIRLGARAGMTRDATGYGYKTIRQFCRQAALSLIERNQVRPFRQSKITRWADNLFLDLLQHRPDIMPYILLQIGRNMTGDQFAKFMMVNSPLDVIQMIRAAPVKPFALSLIGGYRWI